MVSVLHRPAQALGRRRRHAQPHTVVHLSHGLCWWTHHDTHALCLAYHPDDGELLPPPQRRPAKSYPRCHHLRYKHRGHLRISGPHRHLAVECQHLERFEHKRCVQHLPIPFARGLCCQFLGRLRNHAALQLEQQGERSGQQRIRFHGTFLNGVHAHPGELLLHRPYHRILAG